MGNDTWGEWGKHVLSAIEAHNRENDDIRKTHISCREDMISRVNKLQTKVEILAWKIGIILGVIFFVLNVVFKRVMDEVLP